MIRFYAEEISERLLPTYIAPWQNFFLRVMLWLLVPFIIWAVVEAYDWAS